MAERMVFDVFVGCCDYHRSGGVGRRENPGRQDRLFALQDAISGVKGVVQEGRSIRSWGCVSILLLSGIVSQLVAVLSRNTGGYFEAVDQSDCE